MYFHCCQNRDTNSSAVSLQGFSKEAPSGAGLNFDVCETVLATLKHKLKDVTLALEALTLH